MFKSAVPLSWKQMAMGIVLMPCAYLNMVPEEKCFFIIIINVIMHNHPLHYEHSEHKSVHINTSLSPQS